MRQGTINQLTLFQAGGIIVNLIAVAFMINSPAKDFDIIFTIAAVNICYVIISRTVTEKLEQLSREKYGKN